MRLLCYIIFVSLLGANAQSLKKQVGQGVSIMFKKAMSKNLALDPIECSNVFCDNVEVSK